MARRIRLHAERLRCAMRSVHARSDLGERRLARRRRIVAEWCEAAVVGGPELAQRDEFCRLDHAVRHFLRRLDDGIDRIDHADEHALLRLEVIFDDS